MLKLINKYLFKDKIHLMDYPTYFLHPRFIKDRPFFFFTSFFLFSFFFIASMTSNVFSLQNTLNDSCCHCKFYCSTSVRLT